MHLKQVRSKSWAKRGLWLVAVVTLLLSACGEPPKEAEQDETLQASNSANYTTHYWLANSSSYTSIGYDSEKFCYLSSIQGNFAGSADSAHVYTHYGSWILAVNSGTGSTIGAEAICVKWSALSTPTLSPANSVKWLSPEFSATAPYSGNPNDCTVPYVQTWWGDAATYLSGVSGDLASINGPFILQNSGAFTPSQFGVARCWYPTTIQGWARSMFMGQPHVGDLPQFWGPSGAGVPISSAGSYHASTRYTASVEMAPVDQAFCYLTSVWGDFDATYDSVRIYEGINAIGQRVWKLRAYDSNPANAYGLGASASCYMLAQY